MFKGKLLKKLIFFSVFMILMYTIFIIVMWFRSDVVIKSEEFDEKNSETVSTISMEFDENLTRVISLCEKLGEDEDIVRFATVNDSENHGYQTLTAVEKMGEIFDNFSNPECLIGVFSANKDTVALPTTSIDVARFSKHFGVGIDVLEEMYRYFAGSKSTRTLKIYDKPISGVGQEKLLVFFNKRNGNSDFMVSLLIDADYLFGNIGDNHLSCVVNGTSVLGYGSDDIDYEKYIEKNQNCYSAQSAAYSGVSFLLCSRNYAYVENNFRFLTSVLTFGILLFVIITVSLMIIIKKIYKPIGKVVNQIKVYSNVDDNDEAYILENNFETLKKRNEELVEKMNIIDVHLREKAIMDILSGVVTREKANELISTYGLQMPGGSIAVTVVEITAMDNLKNISANDEILDIKNQIFKTIREQFNLGDNAEYIRISENRMALLSTGCDEKQLKEILSKELSIVEAYYGVIFKTSTGSVCETVYDTKNSYLEAVSMLEMEKGDGKSFVSSTNFSLNEFFYYPLEVENTLISCVRQGDSEKTALLLENIVRKNYSVGLSDSLLSEFRLAMIVTLKRLFQLSGRAGNVSYVEQHSDEETFLKWITDEFLNVISESENVSQKNTNKLLSQITEFIKQNYSKDISLTDISFQYDISQGYIGKLFRENMNTTFKDYLNRYRIDMAKEMIQADINVKLLSVAENVGFTNAITFNRVFKKYENVSPSEYKELLLSGYDFVN